LNVEKGLAGIPAGPFSCVRNAAFHAASANDAKLAIRSDSAHQPTYQSQHLINQNKYLRVFTAAIRSLASQAFYISFC
jgi:hypothetical protein